VYASAVNPTRNFPGGPRTRVAFLVVAAVGVFLLRQWWLVAAAAAAMAAAWLGLGLGARPLARQIKKLLGIATLIIAGYALFAIDPATDRWVTLDLRWFELEINNAGARAGATMALRILAVVMASHVARAGDPRSLAAGMRRLGLPRLVAAAIDATLELLGGRGGGGGGGGGRGTGGGRGRGQGQGDGEAGEGFGKALGRLARGDVSPMVKSLNRHLARVEQFLAERDPELSPHAARDAAVIAGVALTMLGIKILKLLPGLPFAPGHKGVLLIPLYFVAASMTRTRLGATWTGLTMGIVAFLLGDGRYGVFEIAKHVAPGLLVDLLFPLIAARRGAIAWSIVGLIAALGRFATITLIALAVQPPAIVYAVLLPGLAVHGIFGALSGLVTAPLLRALDAPVENEPR